MTTATKSPKAQTPTTYGLVVALSHPVEPELKADIDAYHADCCDLENRITEWRADVQTLYADCAGMVVMDAVDRKEELERDRASLESEIAPLQWRKFDLIPRRKPAYKKAIQIAEANRDGAIKAERSRLAGLGITAASVVHPNTAMPLYDTNSDAAEILFTRQIELSDSVRAAQERLNLAVTDLRVVESQCGIAVVPEQCKLSWPQVTAHAAVMRLLA